MLERYILAATAAYAGAICSDSCQLPVWVRRCSSTPPAEKREFSCANISIIYLYYRYRVRGLWIASGLRYRVPGFEAAPCPRLTAQNQSWRGPRSFATLGISSSMTVETGLPKLKAGSRKRKADSPCVLVRQSIQAAVKEGSWESAYKSYEEAKAEGIRLQADAYNSLLFLCAHGDAWEDRCSGMRQPGTEEIDSERLRIGQQVFSKMQSELGQPSEMWYETSRCNA